MWKNTGNVERLKEFWANGLSAGQIATQLNCSRSAVCAKLSRLGLRRGHMPPTAKPTIVAVPKGPPTNRQRRVRQPPRPMEYTKPQLYAMLAQAVRNTG